MIAYYHKFLRISDIKKISIILEVFKVSKIIFLLLQFLLLLAHQRYYANIKKNCMSKSLLLGTPNLELIEKEDSVIS